VLSLAPFYEIAVVTLALGSDPYASEVACDEAGGAQRMAVQRLRDAGVLTVAAAGNDSLTNALALPACLSNVVGVGSVSDSDRVSSFSNSASFLSLLAPGEGIETADPMAGTAVASGTSMAAAHVAGAVASLREAVPTARVGEVQNALSLAGRPVRDTRNGLTVPRLSVAEAVEMLASGAAGGSSGGSGSVPLTGGGASGSGGGGSSACGLIGVEPFLVLGLARVWRRRRGLGGGGLS
jgi:subtilisin family serine protease